MIGGYLLAIAPTILILTGAVVGFSKYLRKPSPEWSLLFGFCAVVAYAFYRAMLASWYGQIKAFYALSALTPFCCFAAIGWDTLTRGRKKLQLSLGALFLVWAMNSFGSMWIRESGPQQVGRRGSRPARSDAEEGGWFDRDFAKSRLRLPFRMSR